MTITAEGLPTENRITTGIRYAKAGMICIASSTGVITLLKRFERPAQMPSGMPIASETMTDATISARVCMLSAQSPITPNESRAPVTTSDARQPHQRRVMPTSARPTPTNVMPFRRSVNDVTSQFRKLEIWFRK